MPGRAMFSMIITLTRFPSHSPFLTTVLLAGTASWGLHLRGGGAAAFCFVRQLTDTLGVSVPPKNEPTIFRSVQKSRPWLGEQAPLALGAPRAGVAHL